MVFRESPGSAIPCVSWWLIERCRCTKRMTELNLHAKLRSVLYTTRPVAARPIAAAVSARPVALALNTVAMAQ